MAISFYGWLLTMGLTLRHPVAAVADHLFLFLSGALVVASHISNPHPIFIRRS